MLTKIGIAALLGTIGTAALGGVAKADEPCNTGFIPPPSSVTVVAPPPVRVVAPPVVVTPVDYRDGDRDRYAGGYGYGYGYGYGQPGVYYRDGRREEWREHEWREHERREHERREWAWRHRRGYGW